MPLTLTVCAVCTASLAPFATVICELLRTYEGQLAVVELNCMAACEDVPAVMIDYDYFPSITPEGLYARIKAQLPT